LLGIDPSDAQREIEEAEEKLVLKAQGLDEHGQPLHPTEKDEQTVFGGQQEAPEEAKQSDQAGSLAGLRKEAKNRGAWEGFKRPKDKADRLRAGVPWKFRTRGSFFGDVSRY
jgi:hypothetical protein